MVPASQVQKESSRSGVTGYDVRNFRPSDFPMKVASPETSGRHPWVYQASMPQIVAITVAFWLSVWALDSGLDVLWARYGRVVAAPMAMADALVALTFAAVVLKLMLMQRARHRMVVRQLKTVAEMNHHIRNALNEIELRAYITHNAQFIADIQGASARIQWALCEILPAEEEGEG